MPQSKDNKSADRTLATLETFEEFKRPLTSREIGERCAALEVSRQLHEEAA